MAEQNEFLSLPEAAALMGISRIAVFKKVKKGQLAAIRIGRNWAVPAAALENPPAMVPPSAPPAPRKALKTKSIPPPRTLALSEKARRQPHPPVPKAPLPQKDPMDDMGWD